MFVCPHVCVYAHALTARGLGSVGGAAPLAAFILLKLTVQQTKKIYLSSRKSDTQYTRERRRLKGIQECVMSTNLSLHGQQRLQDTISWHP